MYHVGEERGRLRHANPYISFINSVGGGVT